MEAAMKLYNDYCSGIVYLLPPDRVAKCPNPRNISRGEVEHERRVYETLGSHPRILVLYELYTGCRPYDEIGDEEVVRLYGRGVFPRTDHIPVRSVVLRCWTGEYESAATVMSDFEKVLTAPG